MLKRKALRKIFVTTFVLFILLTIYLIPGKKEENKQMVFHYSSPSTTSVYLMNDNHQLTKVDLKLGTSSLEKTMKSIIEKLTFSNDATIPNGLKQVIPKNVRLLDLEVTDQIVSLHFSKEFQEIPLETVEKIVEAIAYSLLSISDIKGVSIYVEEKNISQIFSMDIPDVITKDYGINKRYELKSFSDISQTVVYYMDNIDNQNYYVPITKYTNDSRDKIKIIIDELSSNYIYESNLITLLDKSIKLMNYEINQDTMILNFNNSIFMEKDSILEEVVYSISYSVFANYDVQEVIFEVNNEEIGYSSVKG